MISNDIVCYICKYNIIQINNNKSILNKFKLNKLLDKQLSKIYNMPPGIASYLICDICLYTYINEKFYLNLFNDGYIKCPCCQKIQIQTDNKETNVLNDIENNLISILSECKEMINLSNYSISFKQFNKYLINNNINEFKEYLNKIIYIFNHFLNIQEKLSNNILEQIKKDKSIYNHLSSVIIPKKSNYTNYTINAFRNYIYINRNNLKRLNRIICIRIINAVNNAIDQLSKYLINKEMSQRREKIIDIKFKICPTNSITLIQQQNCCINNLSNTDIKLYISDEIIQMVINYTCDQILNSIQPIFELSHSKCKKSFKELDLNNFLPENIICNNTTYDIIIIQKIKEYLLNCTIPNIYISKEELSKIIRQMNINLNDISTPIYVIHDIYNNYRINDNILNHDKYINDLKYYINNYELLLNNCTLSNIQQFIEELKPDRGCIFPCDNCIIKNDPTINWTFNESECGCITEIG